MPEPTIEELTKKCTKCGIEKSISDYRIHHTRVGNKKTSIYYNSQCNKCENKRVNDYRINNYESVKKRKKEYWLKNRGRLLAANNEKSRIYNKLNPEKRKASANAWANRNRQRNIDYTRNRYNSNPQFNIAIKHRGRINMALKRIGFGRKDRMIELLGCTYAFFKKYIESKFTSGMNWDMVLSSKIHLDHIKPCSKFNLLDFEQQKICFHYTNYQPLWAADNMEKHNKYEEVCQT